MNTQSSNNGSSVKTSKVIAIVVVGLIALKVAASLVSMLWPNLLLILAATAIWAIFIRDNTTTDTL